MTIRTEQPSICRMCHAACPITVEMEDGKPIKVTGNKASPTYHAFCCSRGQASVEHINHPDRLLSSMKRQADGSFAPIGIEQAMDEIADKIKALIDANGPRSLAAYFGTYSGPYPAAPPMLGSLVASLGSPMIFASATIDQPGKDIANAMLGQWKAGPQAFADADVWLMLGGNPLVSIAGGIPSQNPARRLTDKLKDGMKLIVIDPRRSETAARAHIHLRPTPGEDSSLLAAMLHVIINESLYDAAFVADNVAGFAALAAAVEVFSPAFAAARADVPEQQIIDAARLFATAKRGVATGLTGANMSGHSSLVEYLMLCMNTLCGRFVRAGEAVANPGVLLPRATPVAEAVAPAAYANLGEKLRVRGLAQSASGMPTAALADEILLEGEGQVKALIINGGNPVAAWPDQEKTVAAMKALELLVHVDIKMSATAKLADYIIAPKVSFEVPTMSLAVEQLENFSYHWGLCEPFGMYAPALVEPPAGSDLIEEWEFYYGLAQRLDIGLFAYSLESKTATAREGRDFVMFDMVNKPTTDEVFEILSNRSRIPLTEVKQHPNGALFPEAIIAQARSQDCDARLDIGNTDMMAELATVQHETTGLAGYPYKLVCRRMKNAYNSSLRDLPKLVKTKRPYNPAFMHPDDLDELGVGEGENIVITSIHGEIIGIANADKTLKRGILSMAHAFGDVEQDDRNGSLFSNGSSTSRLVSTNDSYDRFSGMPRMSALPIKICKH
ncbi:anaerobic selenocysteine-containing dehydrogenase [Zhongshania antarctica]|uniref:Anaerobic selenocysteine-containing dehydrogenase n=1 Tax=Zhongshania antarctica TaxID=641702 RepID=A0A840R941_9GAMM|nr:molybdopterin-dependent oxidoreductase [Zhongshania antarctica]MBB5188882.1 anaerobic selenocysteine-containing dehydrogenase [Zhongshania antarctica]